MEKKEIVQKFFEEGVLLSPTTLDKMNEEAIQEIINNNPPLIITALPETTAPTITYPEKKKTLTVQDIATFYQRKYEGIKKLLLPKLSPVSISNAATPGEVALIGLVGEHTPSGFIAEDPTGRIEVVTTKKLQLGDVVGITGQAREGRIMEKDVVYPDIPLPKEVKRIKATLLLTHKKLAEQGTQLVYGVSEGRDIIPILGSPAKLSLQGTEILIFEGEGIPQEWLMRRCLPERATSSEDFCLIEKVPDIFWFISTENKTESYKGVTIVQTDKQSFARVNMFTREVEFGKI